MEQAQLPWSPKRHQVWPASFRRAALMLMRVGHHLARDATRVAPSRDAWLEVISFCGRDWFRQKVCDWCQQASPRLLRCTGCRRARYCGKACSTAAWKTHKKACKAEQRRLKSAAAAEGKEE